jgi:hypothetical protein
MARWCRVNNINNVEWRLLELASGVIKPGKSSKLGSSGNGWSFHGHFWRALVFNHHSILDIWWLISLHLFKRDITRQHETTCWRCESSSAWSSSFNANTSPAQGGKVCRRDSKWPTFTKSCCGLQSTQTCNHIRRRLVTLLMQARMHLRYHMLMQPPTL